MSELNLSTYMKKDNNDAKKEKNLPYNYELCKNIIFWLVY
jgi:hypothetical protein